MSFGGNTEPRKFGRKDLDKAKWYCFACDSEVKHYFSKCPTCGARRPH